MFTRHERLRPSCVAAAAFVLALTVAGCHDARIGSSNRGSGSHTVLTSVENAYLVPQHIAGNCAIQVGDVARLHFTATNSRATETERLLSITTAVADAVRMTPETGLEIPPGSSIAAGQPVKRSGSDPASFEVTVQGMRQSLSPGMSADVTFRFEKAGAIEVRTPVEACPVQDQRGA
jgi:hypothetical protein